MTGELRYIKIASNRVLNLDEIVLATFNRYSTDDYLELQTTGGEIALLGEEARVAWGGDRGQRPCGGCLGRRRKQMNDKSALGVVAKIILAVGVVMWIVLCLAMIGVIP